MELSSFMHDHAAAIFDYDRNVMVNFTTLLKNMWILKFKSPQTFVFFAAVNHLSRPLRKQKFTSMGSKGCGLWFVIGGFRSSLCVSLFHGSLLVIVIVTHWRQQKMQLWKQLLNFRVGAFLKKAVCLMKDISVNGTGSSEHKIWILPKGANPMTFWLEVHTVHIIK